jgi:hypothetical protein
MLGQAATELNETTNVPEEFNPISPESAAELFILPLWEGILLRFKYTRISYSTIDGFPFDLQTLELSREIHCHSLYITLGVSVVTGFSGQGL